MMKKPKPQQAKILSVQNRKGDKFKIGDPVFFMGIKSKIKAFRTDSPYPNHFLIDKKEVDRTYWVMAELDKYWANIDFISKNNKK